MSSFADVVRRVLLMGAALAGCGSPPGPEARQAGIPAPDGLVAERIRARIEADGAVAALRAGGEPIYESAVLPGFYEGRLYHPAWSDERGPAPVIHDLVNALRQADREGLRPDDYHLAAIDTLLAAVRADVRSGGLIVPDRWAELDLLLTDAFLVYGSHLLAGRVNHETLQPEWVANRRGTDFTDVLQAALESGDVAAALVPLAPPHRGFRRLREALAYYRTVVARGGWPAIPDGRTLKPGDRGPAVAALRERLRLEGDLGPTWTGEETDLFDEVLERAMKRFQRRHGLTADGAMDAATRAELNVSAERRVEQVELNLERWRWLPKDLGRRHIVVNIAAFALDVVEEETVVLSMRVVVGLPYRRTPVFSDTMRYLVLNPSWHVPPSLAVQDLLPRIQRDSSYLAGHKVRVFQGWGPEAREVRPDTVDWSAITPDRFPYRLVQDPGPLNALGRIKFMFLNRFNVYLHDSPARPLFDEAERDFSSGCIRVERAVELAAYLLHRDPRWSRAALLRALDGAVDGTVPLPEPIPIHLLYWTAWADWDGTIQFRRDIYDRDAPLRRALRAPLSTGE
jgi:murein L,D-transpeptidase YcbB/YkuD